jgi:tRNA (guanine-N(7)-)-methyltransferase
MSRGRRIARIKLVPPSPEAAQDYLLEWDNQALYHSPHTFPKLTSKNLFDAAQPMVLEVGCGTGEFLLELAQSRPAERFLGVEISRRTIYHAVNQVEKLSLRNVKFIKADIKLLYPLMAPCTWTAVHLNFPDPNYGAGRRKHRIFSSDFLDACAISLTPMGKISVVTDHFNFLEDMLQIAESDERFEKTHRSRYIEGRWNGVKTRFQSAWERLERPVYRFELVPTAAE